MSVDLAALRWGDWWENPYPLYREMRAAGPVFHDLQNDAYLVTRHRDIWNVLISPERFSNVPFHLRDNPSLRISTLRNSDPPRHTWIRQIVTPLFFPKALRRLDSYFDDIVTELLDKVERQDTIEVSRDLAKPLPGRVTCDLLGVPLDQHEMFLELTNERLAHLHAQLVQRPMPPGSRSFEEVRGDLWRVIEAVAADRRRHPREDAITLCVQAQEKYGREQFDDELMVDLLLQLLTGGFQTTQHLVEMFLNFMADHDEIWQRLRQDPSLVPAAIEEMLRYDAPVQALPRYTYEEQEVDGVKIPSGAEVWTIYGSANRDESVFNDPDGFSLDRRPNRHMTFSAGIHHCPGAPVSRFEVTALIEQMVDRYERIEHAGPAQRRYFEKTSASGMHGYDSVPLRLVRGADRMVAKEPIRRAFSA